MNARVLLLMALLVLVACSQRPATPAVTDATIETTMAGNINDHQDSTAAIPRDAKGKPDISFQDGVLFVATRAPGTAAELCRLVAAITNSPDTAQPLGVLKVVVISGSTKLAECKP